MDIESYGDNPPHVGHFVRRIIFEKCCVNGRIRQASTVGDAAELLKIGRPALSNVLNGNADLSVSLAAKIEDVFAYKAEALLIYQTKYQLLKYRQETVSEILPVFAGDLSLRWSQSVTN